MTPPSKGLSDFIAEATEILDGLGNDAVLLDDRRGQEVDPELINRIFRGAHSLKGLAGMFGQERVAQLAHHAEELLDRLRMGKVSLSDQVVDALAESIDVFNELLAEAAHDAHSDAAAGRASRLAEQLEKLAEEAPQEQEELLDRVELPAETRAVFTEYEEHRLRENIRKDMALWKVRAAFDLSDFDQGLAQLNSRLKPLGEVISTLPSAQPGGGSGIAFDLIFGTRTEKAGLEAALEGLPTTLEPIPRKGKAKAKKKAAKKAPAPPSRPPPVVAAPEPPEPFEPSEPFEHPTVPARGPSVAPREVAETSLRSLTQTVRVDIRRLDILMNTVGELLLVKGNLQRLAEAARSGLGASPKLWGQELARETRAMERKLDELQKGLLEARMVPLGQVFDKLARLVRRIARDAGKEIDFVVAGGEVELDKLIVEELSDPLMHIIRNAIDHGVEPPEARARNGKSRRGRVSLEAAQKGNHVVIELLDDGAGIDVDRIREVALQRGLISVQEAQEMNARELCNLIFLPGFSTARSVSELSGRGVGLDVVKTNISNLSGLIDVSSERGKGSTFTITLPVTLAIIRALVVSVSGRVYAVPLNSVLEITTVQSHEIRTVERREVMLLRGQTLSFTRLSRLFGHGDKGVARHFVVVVGLAQERLGIAVDELLGQQDIVIKPLGGRLQHIRGISGATDLGNRRTVLVLDVGALMEEVFSPERRADFL